MSLDINTLGSQKVKRIPDGESVELQSFWQDQNAVIIFFRRWGCLFCRLWAKELSEIAPILKKNNIKLVGIGVEEIGSKEFIDGKYFDEELFYVEDLATYKMLDFKRFSVFSILKSLLWKQSRDAITKGRSMGLHNDLTGDGLQNGGALLVSNGGKILCHYVQNAPTERLRNLDIVKIGGVLFVEKGGNVISHFIQTGPSDHMPNEEILKVFGLENNYKANTMVKKIKEEMECETEAAPKYVVSDVNGVPSNTHP